MLNFIKNIGPTELIVIAVILILIFGGKAIAGLGKTGGETVREIKNIKKEFTEAVNSDSDESVKES
ncbi:MAG TPA: twin-arginine translocase TatA/TatE family subunit [Patescibacteria group bacterium]|nr:twin-arginine translocase TatA/TatE family subunit [Patescibacteria group bacterium]